MKKPFVFLALVVLTIGVYFVYTENVSEPTACTLEAKMCPDGSFVGRTGPDCEFQDCPRANKKTLTIGDATLVIEVADTPEKRTLGLSNRVSLDENAGMLFVFDNLGVHHFWMKDTLIPLDMIWLRPVRDSVPEAHEGSNGDDIVIAEIVHIEEDVTPDTYPQTFASDEPALYVLEVNAGFVASHGIVEGSVVRFDL